MFSKHAIFKSVMFLLIIVPQTLKSISGTGILRREPVTSIYLRGGWRWERRWDKGTVSSPCAAAGWRQHSGGCQQPGREPRTTGHASPPTPHLRCETAASPAGLLCGICHNKFTSNIIWSNLFKWDLFVDGLTNIFCFIETIQSFFS